MKFEVDDDLAALVERLAKRSPFENLSFSDALRRILEEVTPDELFSKPAVKVPKEPKKAPSPNPAEWASIVPALKSRRNLNTWRSICDQLEIDTGGDSARRKLKNWVKANHPDWPPVPDID